MAKEKVAPEDMRVWVESPDGKLIQEHTIANARDLVKNAGWKQVVDPKAQNTLAVDKGDDVIDPSANPDKAPAKDAAPAKDKAPAKDAAPAKDSGGKKFQTR